MILFYLERQNFINNITEINTKMSFPSKRWGPTPIIKKKRKEKKTLIYFPENKRVN